MLANFIIIVVIQFLWFIAVTAWTSSWGGALKTLGLGMLIGLPLGGAFDLIIGYGGGIFRYIGVRETGLFTALNGLLSYGLAASTVLTLRPVLLAPYPGRLRRSLLAGLCVLLGGLIAFTIGSWHTLFLTFVIGAEVLACGEAFCLALGRKGLLFGLVEYGCTPMLRLWTLSTVTGCVYEIANWLFPLWNWVDPYPSRAVHETLIVVFGYFVLFYPIWTAHSLLCTLFGKELRDRRRLL